MRTTKYIWLILFSFFLFFSFRSYASDRNVAHAKKLIFEYFPNNAPISFINQEGAPDGLVIELFNKIVEELNDSCSYRPLEHNFTLEKSNNANDSTIYVYALIYSADRAQHLYFSTPFITHYYDIVLRDNENYDTVELLRGKRIIVKKNTMAQTILENLGPDYTQNMILVPDMEVGLKMLSGGEGDAALCLNTNALKIIESADLKNLRTIDSDIPPQEMCFASTDTVLINRISRILNLLIRDGQYQKIYHHWNGEEKYSYAESFYWALALLVLVASLLFFILYLFRLKVKGATAAIKASNDRVTDLNQLLNMLIGQSEINIFMYDIPQDKLFILINGEFEEYYFTLQDIESLIHPDDRGRYDKSFDDIIKGIRSKVVSSLRLFVKDEGRYCDYEFVVTSQRDENDKICRLIYSRRDESRQRQLMRRQDDTILNLDLALQSAQLIQWKYDIINDMIHLIDCRSNRYSYTEADWVELISPECREIYMDFIHRVLQNNEESSVVIFVKTPESDSYAPYELTAVARYNKNGELLSLHGILNDISTIYNYQSQLNEKIEVLNAINNHIPLGFVFLDKEGTVQEINNHLIEIFAIKNKENVIGKYNYLNASILSNDMRAELKAGKVLHFKLDFNTFQESLKHDIDDTKSHGTIFDARISAVFSHDKELLGYIILFEDVTQLHHTKGQVNELQENFTLALEAGDLTIWTYDYELETFKELQGPMISDGHYTKAQFVSVVHPDDCNMVFNTIDELIAQTVKKANIKFRMFIMNEWRWYQCSVTAIIEEDKIRYISGIRKDITEEIVAKELLEQKHIEIRNSEEKLNLILNMLPIPVYIIEPQNSKVTYINEAAMKLFATECFSTVSDFVAFDDVEKHNSVNLQVLNSGNEYIGNEILRLNNGKELNTYVRKSVINFNGDKHILILRMDLTAQRKAEITNKILSASLPSLKAYTWYIDSRDNILRYGDVMAASDRNLHELDSMEKFTELIHEEDRDEYYNNMNALFKLDNGNGKYCFRIDIEKIGQYEWWESRAILETLHDDDGSGYKFMYGIDINITDQKEIEHSLQNNQYELAQLNKQNELILNNTTSGIVFLDSNYKVQWSNVDIIFKNISSQLYINGTNCYTSFGYTEPCPNCPVREAILQRKIGYHEFEVNDRTYGSTAIPILNDSDIEGIVLRIDDITERNRLITDLRHAKEKAEESEKLKMAFLANVSHEIRTPLNAIVGFSELIQYAENDSDREEYVKIINSNNELLLRLIGDVLDLSKIESGSIDIKNETFDVLGMINETFTALKTRNTNPNVEMTLDTNLSKCVATLDRNRFAQVGINFLSNAIKYTKQGTIAFSLEYVDKGLKIMVKDTGIGIEESKQHTYSN